MSNDLWGYPLDGRTYQSDPPRRTVSTDYKFTGKQRDTETGYDYFGARYYDARIARWGGVEPLLEKYISFTPYQYGLLNPIKYVDPKGKDVRATSDEAQQMILNTIPKELRKYVKFNKDGYIDKDLINKIVSKSGNYEALKKLATDSRLFDVIIEEGFDYKNEFGVGIGKYFGEIEICEPENRSPYDPSTGEDGFTGVTVFPGNKPKTYNSPDETIRIVINSGLSIQGLAEIFSNEAYGHAYLYIVDPKNYEHKKEFDKEGKLGEANEILYDRIINAMKETKLNMEGK